MRAFFLALMILQPRPAAASEATGSEFPRQALTDESGATARLAEIPKRAAASMPGSIGGRVVRAGGTPLAGAVVRIAETGQVAIVDDQGSFRFPKVPPGRYNLTVSSLGFEPLSRDVRVRPGLALEARFELANAVADGVSIVIFGTRSARANALNLQRSAENSSDVIAGDDLGHFGGTTFSDALRRAPGVSFQRDPLTGDGTNVVVRGLEPGMNAVKLNGLTLPVGNGTGRSPDLSNFLADSVGRITVHKSLLPRHDSSGTGGLIEVETLSPLSRPARYASLQIEGGRGPRGFSGDFLVSGTLSGRFGAKENLGLSASVQYRENSARSISYGTLLSFGRYLPPDSEGRPTLDSLEDVHPLLAFPFSPGAGEAYPNRLEAGFNHVDQSTLAATVSAEWRWAGHTNLRLDAVHSSTRRTTFTLTDAFSALIGYADRPGAPALAELKLDLAPGNKSLRRQQSYVYDPDARLVTNSYSLKGRSAFGDMSFDYMLGHTRGTERHPDYLGFDLLMPDSEARPEYFLPKAVDGETGYIISPFAPRTGRRLPLPLLTDAGWAFVNDPSNFVIGNAGGQLDIRRGSNDRYTGSLSARYDAARGPIRYIEAGAYYERASFRSDLVRSQLGGNVSVQDLGLSFAPSDLRRIGIDVPGFVVIDEGSIAGFVDRIDELTATTGLTLTPIVPHPDQARQYTLEETLAAYLQARIEVGRLEIIGGVRLNRTRLEAANLIFPTYIGPILPANGGGFGIDLVFRNAFTQLESQQATGTDFLPRLLLNYRVNDNLIIRGGYFSSVARPQIAQLSSQTRITFINIPIPGPSGIKPILEISTGNPDLRPARTHNLDLSLEHYSKDIGVLRLSGFYKHIENLLQANVTNGPVNLDNVILPDHPYFQGGPFFDPKNAQNYFITGRMPVNSDRSAFIWGLEAQVERRFTFLPGFWGGFGLYANYTFTRSSRAERYSWASAPPGEGSFEFLSVPFAQQPRHSGTVALTYNKYGFDSNLTYGFQSRSLGRFEPRGLSAYSEGVETLDFRAEYFLRFAFGRLRLYVEALDLLKGPSSPDLLETLGGAGETPRFHTRATYLGGRKFKLGVSATF